MKKQITAMALGLLMVTNLMPQMTASAANVPTSKTITLPSESIWSTVGDVKVEVTYTGFIGELDAAANGLSDNDGTTNGKIPVLKEGSDIKFKIIADDPAAYYNFCYEKTRYNDSVTNGEYGWDDAGGGRFYYDAQNNYFDVQVYGQADGTSKFAAGPLFQDNLKAFGRKISKNVYSYKAINGLVNYQFTAKDKPVNNVYIPQGGVAGYTLGTALTINDAQIKELEQTGTMTFLKGISIYGQSLEYKHVYKGISDLLETNTSENTDDNNVSDWAKKEFDKANELGLVPSLTDSPKYQQAITREQFAEIIVNMTEKTLGKQIEAASDDTFTDTTNESVLKAYKAGIITGVGEGKFDPKTTTNREQIATMIYRATEYLKAQTNKDLTPNAASVEKFTDKANISSWAAEGIGKLAANYIMNGTSATTASPKDLCTVEQSILLIYRVYNVAL